VVATRVGGIPEVIEPGVTGQLVGSGEVLPLADALCAAITDRERALAMARVASQRVVARVDVSRMAREYHRNFIEMLSGPGAGLRPQGANGAAIGAVPGALPGAVGSVGDALTPIAR
jgi:hypothetical protein